MAQEFAVWKLRLCAFGAENDEQFADTRAANGVRRIMVPVAGHRVLHPFRERYRFDRSPGFGSEGGMHGVVCPGRFWLAS